MNHCTPAGAQSRLALARPAGKIDVVGAGSLERFGCRHRFALIDFVGGAKTGERRAGGFEGVREGGAVELVIDRRFDAAGLEEILGESRARR